jgi:hypothetical protein
MNTLRITPPAILPPIDASLAELCDDIELALVSDLVDTERPWFIAMNPDLDDEALQTFSPRTGRARSVMTAAHAFRHRGLSRTPPRRVDKRLRLGLAYEPRQHARHAVAR